MSIQLIYKQIEIMLQLPQKIAQKIAAEDCRRRLHGRMRRFFIRVFATIFVYGSCYELRNKHYIVSAIFPSI